MTQPTRDSDGRWKPALARYLIGQSFSLIGSGIAGAAMVWYLVIETTSGSVLAAAVILSFAPSAVVAAFGGALADRFNRKRLIIAADATIAAATLAAAALVAVGASPTWLILAAITVRSAVSGVHSPAVSAMLPQLVPVAHLSRVNGFISTVQSATTLVVPALAGVLTAVLPLSAILLIDVVTAMVGIALLATVRVATPRPSGSTTGYLRDVADGFAYIRSHRFARWLILFGGCSLFFGAMWGNLIPLVVALKFGNETWLLAANSFVMGVGMILGGIVMTVTGGLRNRVAQILLTQTGFSVLVFWAAFVGEFWLFAVIVLLMFSGVAFFGVPSVTLFQERVEPEFLGRVFGGAQVVNSLMIVGGIAIFGPLTDVIPLGTVLMLIGVLSFAMTAIAFLSPAGRRAVREGRRVEAGSSEPEESEVPVESHDRS